MTKRYLEGLATAIAGIPDINERIRTAVRIGKVCANWNLYPGFNWRNWDKACNVDFKQKGDLKNA